MCPPGYHYIAIVVAALGHRDVRLHIHWLNLSNGVTYIVTAKQFKRFQAPKPECSNYIHIFDVMYWSKYRNISTYLSIELVLFFELYVHLCAQVQE